jgi:hypothetical protein
MNRLAGSNPAPSATQFSQPQLHRLSAPLKGAEDTFLTSLKLVIAQRNNVNVFVISWSGCEGMANGWIGL